MTNPFRPQGTVTEAPQTGQRSVRIRIDTGIEDLEPGEAVRIDDDVLKVLEIGTGGNAAFLLPMGSKLRGACVGARVRIQRL